MKLLNTFNKSVHNLNLGAFLHNRYLLYILCILSIVNIVLLGNKRDYNSIIIFIVVAFLTSFFNKNMIVVLSASLLTIYALNYKKSFKEGAENKSDSADSTDSADSADEDAGNTDSAEDTEKDETPIDEQPPATPEITKSTERTALYNNLTKDFQEFQKVQTDLLATMKEIDPLLAKAESFVNKFEGYKEQAVNLKKKQK